MFLILKPLLPFLMLLIKPLPNKPFFPSWVYEFGLLIFLLCQEFVNHSLEWVMNFCIYKTLNLISPSAMPVKSCCYLEAEDTHVGTEADAVEMTVLDLPELPLECILEKLPPLELCNMACVCRDLRERCKSDFLWEKHMREKWGGIVGEAARRKWKLQVASRRDIAVGEEAGGVGTEGWMGKLASVWPLSWLKHKMEGGRKYRSTLEGNSLVSFYQALESGRFSFPAQIYNRENGNSGFLLSCYDAEISYNSRTNSFYARYPAHGKRVPAIEEVPWERIRAPSVDTSAHDLHISDCLSDLRPGDHVEIQWRRNKEFPYGWWYGVVGHLEICDRSEYSCRCHASDTIVVEFNHYAPGSIWRKKTINRREHREDGNEEDGFYGGIRRVQKKEEISMWMQFWPAEVVE